MKVSKKKGEEKEGRREGGGGGGIRGEKGKYLGRGY